jgi:hypothetical protein
MRWLPIIFLLATPAFANEPGEGTFIKYGVGKTTYEQASVGEVKMFSVGHQSPLLLLLEQKWEVGFWSDAVGKGRKSSGFGGWSLGLEPKLGYLYAHSFWGVIGITNTDTMLSTNYQFMQDLGIGFRDERGISLGVGYKHISNAGIKQPNRGRDFFFVQLQIPF